MREALGDMCARGVDRASPHGASTSSLELTQGVTAAFVA